MVRLEINVFSPFESEGTDLFELYFRSVFCQEQASAQRLKIAPQRSLVISNAMTAFGGLC